MQKEIHFERLSDFTGRNGYYKCGGVEVMNISNDMVMMSPLTQRGKVARCDIAIPKEDIPALIALLAESLTK